MTLTAIETMRRHLKGFIKAALEFDKMLEEQNKGIHNCSPFLKDCKKCGGNHDTIDCKN